jgi:ATP-dependent DNA ligase
VVFRHACKLGLEGIVSKRKGSPYRSGCPPNWLKMKNLDAPAVKREPKRIGQREVAVGPCVAGHGIRRCASI